MTVGERIKIRRTELGLSQTDLAIRMGYKDKTGVSKAEIRGDTLTTTTVRKYAEALECTFSYLMGWESAAVSQSLLDRLKDVLDGMSEAEGNEILQYAEYIKSKRKE